MKPFPSLVLWLTAITVLTVAMPFGVHAQQQPFRQFEAGQLQRIGELPEGRFRQGLESLSQAAQQRALEWLSGFHFTEADTASLHSDPSGGIFYVCPPVELAAMAIAAAPEVQAAPVPVHPFPASLIFHSRPGAPNVLYLNFTGETVTNTQWNTEIDRAVIPAVAFNTDSDLTTFSDAEQAMIKQIWQRVAEDYAPFNIDVTTERPATFGTRTAVALITRKTDANGALNPFSDAGGVAYVNVFGTSTYAKYRPAWIYQDNLANGESFISEASSHEIGHNMGLSHDGKTDGSAYYGGHGSDEISWGPLMGTGYNRNVSQWCKGEYYLANNTQDDLATVAGKISYRADDHGGTAGTATALVLSGGTNIVSTTPETDPANGNPANKGVIERNTDVDVFSFVTGSGPVRISVKPWIMATGTRGGNVDIRIELYNEAGTLLLTNNPATQTSALLDTSLPQGRYFLHVRNSNAGNPLVSNPTGYTVYGSLGQYFITGYVSNPSDLIVGPSAQLQVTNIFQTGVSAKQFHVTYSDDVAIDVSTINSTDVRVTGPADYDQVATLVSISSSGNGSPRTATYAIEPPSGASWTAAHNGDYAVLMRANEVRDTEGLAVPAGELGQFTVSVPVVIYFANMNSNPGWTLEPQWQYGPPAYSGNGPISGYTGTNIVGYNLSGNYANNLPLKYATTPVIDCSTSSSLALRFKRWLRTRANDSVAVEVSTNGTTWLNVWSTSAAISDTSWQDIQYTVPSPVAGSPSVRFRWSLASNQSLNEIGWNIDDVEVLSYGTLDVTPPNAILNVDNLTVGGSPSHSCVVTYLDESGVRLSSLDFSDLVVTGPNGYSNIVEFIGADLTTDGSPVAASYAIPAPGDTWNSADNGIYTVLLRAEAVEDTLNNSTPQMELGSFSVLINPALPGVLSVFPENGIASTGVTGGPFMPQTEVYTLTNAGGSTLTWTATATQPWLSISASSGSLPAASATNITLSLNSSVGALPAGAYADTVIFADTASLATHLRNVELTVSPLTLSLSSFATFSPFQVTVLGSPGQTYVIEASTNLLHWTATTTNTTDSNGAMVYTGTAEEGTPARYFRVRTNP